MNLSEYNFDTMNESDVREEILAPLIRELGYKSGDKNSVIREQLIRHPRSSLGRRKNNDPVITGRPDYILRTENGTTWVIEAKPPGEDISSDNNIGQAWSYASHPDIRAVYFCLSNGRRFSVYQTSIGPSHGPILECTYEELKQSRIRIRNLLSPDAIIRDFPTIETDDREPLAPGLRSIARISSGLIKYEKNSLRLKPFDGLVMTIVSGSVQRMETGFIEAHIITQVPFQKLQELNEKLGLHAFSLKTQDQEISTSPDRQTVFSGSNHAILPAGMQVLNLLSWQEVILNQSLTVQNETRATGFLEDHRFAGEFSGDLSYKEIGISLKLSGKFEVQII